MKPLTALEKIKIGSCKGKYKEYCDIVENALKGLERTRQVCLQHDIVDTNELDKVLRQFKELKQDYAMLKEQHDLLVNEQCDKFKALEIIKNKTGVYRGVDKRGNECSCLCFQFMETDKNYELVRKVLNK